MNSTAPKARAPQTRKKAAAKAHVSERKMQQAMNLVKTDPDPEKGGRGKTAGLDKSKGGANPAATLRDGAKSKSETLAAAGVGKDLAHRCEKIATPRARSARQGLTRAPWGAIGARLGPMAVARCDARAERRAGEAAEG